MNTYEVQQCRLIAGHLSPRDPLLTLTAREFGGLVAPTGRAAALSWAQIKSRSFVGYAIRKEFFAEGLRSPFHPTEEELRTVLEAAQAIGRRVRMHKDDYVHPFSSFIINVTNGNNIQWHLKDDPSFEERLVAVWQVVEVKRPAGTGVIE